MSRIGLMPIQIPDGVTVEVKNSEITVAGPRGKMTQSFLPNVEIKIEKDMCHVFRKNDSKQSRSLHGLYRKLISNMVVGASKGFSKVLLVNGVGYRAEVKGETLVLNLGYSNPIDYPIPEGINITVEGNNKINVSGFNKQQLGQVCADIRSFRPPEPYKGKGIRYETEFVRRKIGKTGIK